MASKKLTKKDKLTAAQRRIMKKQKDKEKNGKGSSKFNGTRSNPFETANDKASNMNPFRKGAR